MWRWIAGGLGALLLAVVAVVGVRTAAYGAAESPVVSVAAPAVAADEAALHLSQAIGFRTVSLAGAPGDEPEQFDALHEWLARTYPAFHAAATRERVGAHNLLYTWTGEDESAAPILLLAHQDVVPAADDTRAAWVQDPFAGAIVDDYVWGRGALDDKNSLVALMEAAEWLARQGKKPARTVIFAFGADEETSGEGAAAMAALLAERSIHAWFALDEGYLAVREHPLTGKPAALIGVAEKGIATLRVTAEGTPGHSSMPPPQTAVSALAQAVVRIHDMPIRRGLADGPADAMMRALSPDLPFATRAALANQWLAGSLIQSQLAGSNAAQALAGTTVAPTMIEGGVRVNVLPAEAVARINLRIHPRDTPDALLDAARKAAAGIDGVRVEWDSPPVPASPVSSHDSDSYALIAALSRAVLPEARPAPGLVVGATDARHYPGVAQNVYRFQAVLLGPEDWETMHGVNERISVENLQRLVRFYAGILQAGETP